MDTCIYAVLSTEKVTIFIIFLGKNDFIISFVWFQVSRTKKKCYETVTGINIGPKHLNCSFKMPPESGTNLINGCWEVWMLDVKAAWVLLRCSNKCCIYSWVKLKTYLIQALRSKPRWSPDAQRVPSIVSSAVFCSSVLLPEWLLLLYTLRYFCRIETTASWPNCMASSRGVLPHLVQHRYGEVLSHLQVRTTSQYQIGLLPVFNVRIHFTNFSQEH